MLYEPTKNFEIIERVHVYNDDYSDRPPMRIFYSEADKHFDMIFTMDHVEELAESQGRFHCFILICLLLIKILYFLNRRGLRSVVQRSVQATRRRLRRRTNAPRSRR
jgi:hypothetical protein